MAEMQITLPKPQEAAPQPPAPDKPETGEKQQQPQGQEKQNPAKTLMNKILGWRRSEKTPEQTLHRVAEEPTNSETTNEQPEQAAPRPEPTPMFESTTEAMNQRREMRGTEPVTTEVSQQQETPEQTHQEQPAEQSAPTTEQATALTPTETPAPGSPLVANEQAGLTQLQNSRANTEPTGQPEAQAPTPPAAEIPTVEQPTEPTEPAGEFSFKATQQRVQNRQSEIAAGNTIAVQTEAAQGSTLAQEALRREGQEAPHGPTRTAEEIAQRRAGIEPTPPQSSPAAEVTPPQTAPASEAPTYSSAPAPEVSAGMEPAQTGGRHRAPEDQSTTEAGRHRAPEEPAGEQTDTRTARQKLIDQISPPTDNQSEQTSASVPPVPEIQKGGKHRAPEDQPPATESAPELSAAESTQSEETTAAEAGGRHRAPEKPITKTVAEGEKVPTTVDDLAEAANKEARADLESTNPENITLPERGELSAEQVTLNQVGDILKAAKEKGLDIDQAINLIGELQANPDALAALHKLVTEEQNTPEHSEETNDQAEKPEGTEENQQGTEGENALTPEEQVQKSLAEAEEAAKADPDNKEAKERLGFMKALMMAVKYGLITAAAATVLVGGAMLVGGVAMTGAAGKGAH